jgi:hypothetical protein
MKKGDFFHNIRTPDPAGKHDESRTQGNEVRKARILCAVPFFSSPAWSQCLDIRTGLFALVGKVMETDKQLYKLFTAAPGQLYLLLGLPAPRAVHARAETFKDVPTGRTR